MKTKFVGDERWFTWGRTIQYECNFRWWREHVRLFLCSPFLSALFSKTVFSQLNECSINNSCHGALSGAGETTTSKTKTFEKYDTETTVKHACYTHILCIMDAWDWAHSSAPGYLPSASHPTTRWWSLELEEIHLISQFQYLIACVGVWRALCAAAHYHTSGPRTHANTPQTGVFFILFIFSLMYEWLMSDSASFLECYEQHRKLTVFGGKFNQKCLSLELDFVKHFFSRSEFWVCISFSYFCTSPGDHFDCEFISHSTHGLSKLWCFYFCLHKFTLISDLNYLIDCWHWAHE